MSYLLAGDIGGTKTSLAIISAEAGPGAPLQEATLPSGAYDSLEALTSEFLQGVEKFELEYMETEDSIDNYAYLVEEDGNFFLTSVK